MTFTIPSTKLPTPKKSNKKMHWAQIGWTKWPFSVMAAYPMWKPRKNWLGSETPRKSVTSMLISNQFSSSPVLSEMCLDISTQTNFFSISFRVTKHMKSITTGHSSQRNYRFSSAKWSWVNRNIYIPQIWSPSTFRFRSRTTTWTTWTSKTYLNSWLISSDIFTTGSPLRV